MRKAMLTALLLAFSVLSSGEEYAEVPYNVQAPLLAKTLDFATSLGNEITIFVLDSDDFAAAIGEAVGRPVGEKKIASVTSGKELPQSRPDVLYVGNAKMMESVIPYARDNKVLTVTGHPDLVKEGIALGFGVSKEENKPKILLNRNASKDQSIQWNAAIFKIAVTCEE